MNQSFEHLLLENWTKDMQFPRIAYREPLLDEDITNVLKLACDTFKQDIQVFFMTVDMIEEYIYTKDLHQENISDPFLVINVMLFINSKYFGGGADLKIPLIEEFMRRLSGRKYHYSTIMRAELDILEVLQYKLPFSTVLDDFNTFFEKFMREYRLRDTLKPLCVEILVLTYCSRQNWFQRLKEIYTNEEKTFHYLICSKLFIVAGVLICAFKSTNYQFILNFDDLLEDLKLFTKIHPDHIHALSTILLNIMNE